MSCFIRASAPQFSPRPDTEVWVEDLCRRTFSSSYFSRLVKVRSMWALYNTWYMINLDDFPFRVSVTGELGVQLLWLFFPGRISTVGLTSFFITNISVLQPSPSVTSLTLCKSSRSGGGVGLTRAPNGSY